MREMENCYFSSRSSILIVHLNYFSVQSEQRSVRVFIEITAPVYVCTKCNFKNILARFLGHVVSVK